ncbi:Transcriptional regulatory protein OmpR [Amantichitinum ursilacus]|uniref:Transcriptional regulatory protein OmpR n=2 Tax=Amantichitinum ursilacus TaxID=857265 RepID=A0A0N0GL15_9NEIS|nr:Transcriptional regulatory protein OmpR [Amantichitinum ursilacus]
MLLSDKKPAAPRLLMIEDDVRLARMVIGFMAQNGIQVEHVEDAQSGLNALRRHHYDLILLDLMLPDADGLDVCRRIRTDTPQPVCPAIIMVTARGDPTDRIVGLELGADDYLPKPFEPRELLARVRAVLRRTASSPAEVPPALRFGRLEIDTGARTVLLDRQPRALTSFQFDLLVVLASNAGRVLSRDQLRQAVRGEALEAFDRSIDVHVGRIRNAIEDDPRFPARIITVRGVGYVFSRLLES